MLSKKIITSTLVSCLLLCTLQCKKEEITDDTYFNSKVMILGHRGMGSYYKMRGNTYESIATVIGIGADGSEIDLQLTKDTALVLFHDHEMNAFTTCTGTVYESTLEEIIQCKYNGLQKDVFICSAEELFSKLPNLNQLYFAFDCKLDYNVPNYELYQNQFLRAIKRLCDKYNMSDNVLVEGHEDFLIKAQKMGMTNKLFFSGAYNSTNLGITVKNSFSGLVTQTDDFEMDSDSAHSKGLYLMAYAPYNYYLNLAAVKKDIDILQTDEPISILKEFKRFNYDYVIP